MTYVELLCSTVLLRTFKTLNLPGNSHTHPPPPQMKPWWSSRMKQVNAEPQWFYPPTWDLCLLGDDVESGSSVALGGIDDGVKSDSGVANRVGSGEAFVGVIVWAVVTAVNQSVCVCKTINGWWESGSPQTTQPSISPLYTQTHACTATHTASGVLWPPYVRTSLTHITYHPPPTYFIVMDNLSLAIESTISPPSYPHHLPPLHLSFL
jgi:hypothetical protein